MILFSLFASKMSKSIESVDK